MSLKRRQDGKLPFHLCELLSVQFHHWMNLPHCVVRHVLSTVVLIFRRMAYVPHRFPNNCNDRRFTEGQLLCRASVKRKPCESPTKNGCANLTPVRLCRYFQRFARGSCRRVRPCDAALGIVDHLRRRFARFKLCAHFLDLGGLLVKTCSELCNCRLEVLR